MNAFSTSEQELSQIPAIQLLVNLGYTYLSNEDVQPLRLGKTSNVLLEEVLREQLKQLNRIHHKGAEYLFSEENIQSAIQKLKSVPFDGLVRTNEQLYDLLTLGTSQEQIIEGDKRSFNISYIDWKNPGRNCYHIVSEFSVERSRSTELTRPDLVLFVNGIPLCVIECKSPDLGVDQAISQSIRNQSDDFIPKLFVYSQLVLAVSKNAAMYATTGTPRKFWGVWKEKLDRDRDIAQAINKPLSQADKDKLFVEPFRAARDHFEMLEKAGDREITEQDRALFSLCRPERLLELAYRFTLFDNGIKKVARYQQFFVIKSTLERIQQHDAEGRRKGGVIWHTQGSGKSLTMVMLARCLAMDSGVPNPRIVLVTDRDDLDRQLGNTFRACGLEPDRATSGKNLLDLIAEERASLVTTLVHKFDKALNKRKHVDASPDIFLLIDEAHRSQYKSMHARMKQMLPKACYLGFTGTPLLKSEKNSFAKFGEMIEPHYSITQAVEDGAVLPLLYEGRHVELEQNKTAIDLWFERHTQGLTKEQKADLKKKYARAEMLNKSEQVAYMQAFDISEHYRKGWQGTGLKAQLVAPSKHMAVLYQKFLNEIGLVTSEIIISGPDERDGFDDVDDETTDEVQKFWAKMMKRFGSEEEYTKQIINQFKNGDNPEILIVRDKLLTGFDAPRNTVLYLCRILREHTLLQAIARVNRLHDDDRPGTQPKDFGYIIDYANVLGELDSALNMYSAFTGYNAEDVAGTLTDIKNEVAKLPQRHSDLWSLFNPVRNQHDEEAFERLLGDDALRETFYKRLCEYSKSLAMALSTQHFLEVTEEPKMAQYKADLLRFQKLRTSVRHRYAETVDYKDYEPKIKKLLDTHIQANEVVQLNEPVNIFDDAAFGAVLEAREVEPKRTPAAKADSIAHAVKKVITEKMDEDPAFYKKFSQLIEEAIADFRAQRISDLEYLTKAVEYRDSVVFKKHDDLPSRLDGREDAQAYYGIALPFLKEQSLDVEQAQEVAADIALAVESIILKHHKVNFWDDDIAQKKVVNEIDDYLYDTVKGEKGIELSIGQMDDLIEKAMQVARHRTQR
jgi:type I restriction enzyme, R subunit